MSRVSVNRLNLRRLRWTMGLGSLQCLGVLLLWVIVEQESAVRVGRRFFFILNISYIPFLCPSSLETARHDCNIVVSTVKSQRYLSATTGSVLA